MLSLSKYTYSSKVPFRVTKIDIYKVISLIYCFGREFLPSLLFPLSLGVIHLCRFQSSFREFALDLPVYLFFGFYLLLSRVRVVYLGALYGLIAFTLCSLIAALLQKYELLEVPRSLAFFVSINRFPGFFSDPNSFGVVVLLLLPFFCAFNLIAGLLVFWLGLYSGSRSLVLGGSLFFLFLGVKYLGGDAGMRRYVRLVFCMGVSIGVLWLLKWCDFLPESLRRVTDFSNINNTLGPKIHYFKLACSAVYGNLWFGGGGLGVFRKSNEIFSDHRWHDNLNNQYFEILVAYGVIGTSLLLFSTYHLLRRPVEFSFETSPSLMKVGLGTFLLSALFGTHLESYEAILALVCVLIAINASVKRFPREG